MIINHNVPAINAHRQMGINNSAISKSLEKLSSGLGINRAADNAAGLAISEKMRGQISGLDQAGKNAQDGISLIQTAEGALNETHSILQRMRELSVQSANGTYQDDVDRENIQKEVDALKSEIDRIATSTHYNNIKLLDGSLGKYADNAFDNVSAPLDAVTVNKSNFKGPKVTTGDTALTTGSNSTVTTSTNNPIKASTAALTSAALTSLVSTGGTAGAMVDATSNLLGKNAQQITLKLAGAAADTNLGTSAFTGGTTTDANSASAKKLTEELVNNNVNIKLDNLTIQFTDKATSAGINDAGDILTVDISSLKTSTDATAAAAIKSYNEDLGKTIVDAINANSNSIKGGGYVADVNEVDDDGIIMIGSNTAAGNDFKVSLTAGKAESIVVDFSKKTAAVTNDKIDSANALDGTVIEGDTFKFDGKVYEFTNEQGKTETASGNVAVFVGGKTLAAAEGKEIATALEQAINKQYSASNKNNIKVVQGTGTDAGKLTITANDGLIKDGTIKAEKDFFLDNKKNYTTSIKIDDNLGKSGDVASLDINGKNVEFTIGADKAATITAITDAVTTAFGGAGAAADFGITSTGDTITINSNLRTHIKAEVNPADSAYVTKYEVNKSKLAVGNTFSYGGATVEIVEKAGDAVADGNVALVKDDIINGQQIVDALKAGLAAKGTAEASALSTNISYSNGQIEVAGDKDGTKFVGNTEAAAAIKSETGVTFQIGANGTEDQRVSLNVESMSSATIGKATEKTVNGTAVVDENGDAITEIAKENSIASISVATRDSANDAISIIDSAINQVSGTRADLGALQNRLEHTINSLGVASENLTASESRIRDVDMAKEMMAFTKNQILSQASQAMLAQANTLPQGVLQLLK